MESNEVETTSLLNHEAAKPQPFEPADVSGSEVENPAFTDVPLDLDALQAETDRLQGETRTFKRIRTEDVEETGETEGTEKGSDLVEERADAVAGDSEGDENGPASDILDISRGEVPVTLEDSPKNPRRDLEESESRPSPRRTPSTSSHPGEGSKPLDSDDQISNGDETNEDEDPEPLLKYSRLGGNLVSLLAKDTVSSIRVSDRFLAIGTHGGHVHILDLAGNEIKRFRAHAASVTELALDDRADYLASASDDGRVVVHSLFSAESAAFDFRRPIKAVALEPDYARSSSRTIITGGRNEHVIMASKSWFGSMANTTIHSGEGAIFCIKWCGDMVAWANEYGVQLYHFPSSRRIGHVKRRKGSPRADLYRPHLFWKNQSELLIGWANSVTIVTIRSSGNGASAVPSADPSAARDWEAKAPGDNLMPEITARLVTNYSQRQSPRH